jgi:hypothetical protein
MMKIIGWRFGIMFSWNFIEMRSEILANFLSIMLIQVCDLKECVKFFNEKKVFMKQIFLLHLFHY